MQKTALLLINFQSARWDKKSDYYIENFEHISNNARILLGHAREMDYKIIFIRNLENNGAFSEDNNGSQIIEELTPREWDCIINKRKISCYYQTFLADELEGIENLIICGVLTNLCVRMCTEESYDRGFRIALIEDATWAFTPEIQETTLEDLYNTRPWLTILSLEEFMQ